MIRDFLAPAMFAAGDVDVERLASVFAFVRGNPMAKATLENAVLDAELRAQGRSLASYLGAVRDRVGCGVSVGIAPSTDVLLEQVGGYLAEGYLRIKLKIEPGTDVERVRAVREAYPEILLSVDANAAYRLTDVEVFRALDEFGLLMIEQPLHHEDLWEHSLLQREIRTDVCLDESIRSAADARAAIELGSCRIVNIKQGRVGGLLEAKRVHDVAAELGVPVWCGGMLETGSGARRTSGSPRSRTSGCPATRARRLGTSRRTSPSRSSSRPTAPCPSRTVPGSASTPTRRGSRPPRVGRSGSRKSDKTVRSGLTTSRSVRRVRGERPL